MARLRYNGLTTTLGAALTSADTTVTFAAPIAHSGGTPVPTITGTDYIPLSILTSSDPDSTVSEIVFLTAYTAGATTGTIARAQESTVATAHASGDAVVHAPTAADFATSGGGAFVGAGAERTTAQSIPHASWTTVQFNAADVYDTNSIHDPATNNTRLTIPTGMAGVWRFAATTVFAASNTGVRVVGWKKNGADLPDRYGSVYRSPSAMFTTVTTTTMDLLLEVGDYIELRVYQESGGGALSLSMAYATCQFLG